MSERRNGQNRRTIVLNRLRTRWLRVKRMPWAVLGTLVAIAVVSSLWSLSRTGDWEGAALNFGTEIAGAVVTYVLLDLVLGTRKEKEALIAQMGSGVNDVAAAAAEELRRRGWLTNGSLEGAKLRWANLKGADLWGAKLEGADLRGAHLEGAYLLGAHLERADLRGAHLERVDVTAEQLAQARSLQSATLPDGTDLSYNNWEAEFEEWRKKQEEGDERE